MGNRWVVRVAAVGVMALVGLALVSVVLHAAPAQGRARSAVVTAEASPALTAAPAVLA